MPETAKYVLGRLIKLGNLNNERVVEAIENPTVLKRGEFLYTFTNITVARDREVGSFVFAQLTKFAAQGEIKVVQPEVHLAMLADVPNMIVATSPFVYIPSYSGLAYQHVWRGLHSSLFERIFARLIEDKYDNFFVQATVEPIADLRTFVQRVSGMEAVTRIEATVHPPNPLFGPAWESLRNYIRNRKIDEVHVKETSNGAEGILTSIPRAAELVLSNPGDSAGEVRRLVGDDGYGIGDAAVLMAADGYGHAKVEGTKAGQKLVVRTQESQVAFRYDKNPSPDGLATATIDILQRINDERYLGH